MILRELLLNTLKIMITIKKKHIEIANPNIKYEITFLTLQFTIILNNILQVIVVINVLMNLNSMFNDNQHSYLNF